MSVLKQNPTAAFPGVHRQKRWVDEGWTPPPALASWGTVVAKATPGRGEVLDTLRPAAVCSLFGGRVEFQRHVGI